jgi:hypothetical protein
MSSVLAAFHDQQALLSALHRLRSAELGPLETYTPQPLAEGASPLPLAIFAAGVLAMAASFALQVYANAWAFPLDIGGRPRFSWPAFVPIALENGILAAMAVGFFGYLLVNRLPRLYEPIDEAMAIRRASRDFWCVAVRTDSPEHAQRILQACGADSIEVLAG